MSAGGHLPPITTNSKTLTCPTCHKPWPCGGWREQFRKIHEPGMVLELVGRAPNYGEFCLKCSAPWPCPDAETVPS